MDRMDPIRSVVVRWRAIALVLAGVLLAPPAHAQLPDLDFGNPGSLPAGAACGTSSSCTLAGGTYTVGVFRIPVGVTVSVTGNTPLVVNAGTVSIDGTLNLSAGVAGGGAGGNLPGVDGAGGRTPDGTVVPDGGPAAPTWSWGNLGGGGGGGNGGGGGSGGSNGNSGGAGGNGIGPNTAGGAAVTTALTQGNPGQGGAGGGGGSGGADTVYGQKAGGAGGGGVTGAQGDPQLTTFAAGGGGGHGGIDSPGTWGGQGGAGGGAVKISSGTSIVISGTISADGGDSNCASYSGFGGCGGGGAGGTIWLLAPSVTNSGAISAVGGSTDNDDGGYGRGGGGGAGRIRVDTSTGVAPSGTFVPAIGYTGTIVNPVPFLTALPRAASVAPGGGATTVNLVGAHFSPGALAKVNGAARATTFDDSNHLRVELTAADLASRSTLHITAFNSTPAGGTSNALPVHVTSAQTPVFAAPATYEVGLVPRAIAVGDVDGDGAPDVVVANTYDSTISVLLNAGGTLTLHQTISACNGNGVALGDLNGDGLLDIVQSANRRICRSLGTGGGSFSAAVSYPAPSLGWAWGLVLGDFNRDGALDAAAASGYTNNVVVLPGDGVGGFGAEASNNAVGSYPVGLAAGDFNGDDRLDLVTANQFSYSVSVLLGDGAGSFAPAIERIVGGPTDTPTSVRVADLNGDGILDLIVHLDYPNVTAVLLGAGMGTFPNLAYYWIRAGADGTDEMAIGDVNGDGIPDLVTANANDRYVTYALGDGTGGFGPQATRAVDAGPVAVAVADFNGDGRLDIAVTSFGDDSVNSAVTVLLQAGALGASPTSVSFGVLPPGTSSAPQTVTASNIGPGATGTLSTSIGGTNPGQFAIVLDGCAGTSLLQGGSCQVQVRFTAASAAAFHALLQVNAAGGASLSVPLSGSGSDTVVPAVAVVRPNVSAEKVLTGTAYNLEWTASDNTGLASFNAELSTDGGLTYSAVPGCTGIGGGLRACVWGTPGPATTKGRIRVTAFDTSGNSASDISDANFTIASGTGSITVTAPNSALDWAVGSTQPVKWTHNLGANSWVRIDVSRDGRQTWEVIQPSLKNTGSSSGTFNWVVTDPTVEKTARIRVTGVNVPVADDGNVDFTISEPYVALSAPATTSTNMGYGTVRTQAWTTNLSSLEKVNVLFSTDGGATFPITLASNITATTKTVTYTTPALGTPSANARTRVEWIANPTVGSNSPVRLKVQPAWVRVTVPTVATDKWLVGATQTINWASNLGTSENVRIDLSLDGGSTYPVVLFGSTPSDGAQPVVVQAGWVTANARIRITWLKDAAVTAVSYQAFVIQ